MPKVGEKRLNGAVSFTVVAVDSKFVYVKRSQESKKSLASQGGSYAVPKAEFAGWEE